MEKQILAIGYYHKGQTIMSINQNIQRTQTQYREIVISQLPATCAMRTRFEFWVKDANKASVIVTAEIEPSGEWIAYIGYPIFIMIKNDLQSISNIQYLCDTIHTPEQISKLGDVLDKQSAFEIFPEWRDRKYKNEM